MSKNLVIVESPAKARTIEKFLGNDFHVLSSQGHIRDIEADGKNAIGIDFHNNYAPHYVIDSSKKRLIDTLKAEAKAADIVWLASDLDREGEAIAWHLKEVLALDPHKTRRIVFPEITKNVVQAAIKEPRDIDYNLVNAQQARRVMDRIVGYELSPVLWRKIIPGLSAGRVQSVAVRLIVEREREIENFQPTAQYRITADFTGKSQDGKDVILHTELNHRFNTQKEAEEFLELCKQSTFCVTDIQQKPSKRSPASPFTTSLLQQEASRKLHFPVAKTMRLAQALYEAGKITYMRTDSVNLSALALNTAKQTICEQYGEEYHKMRQYKTASKGAQEAHEAIRPSYMDNMEAGKTEDEKKLYNLIWKRTIASQMADAVFETTTIEVKADNLPYSFIAKGEVILFDGFMKVYIQSTDDNEEQATDILPQLTINEPLTRTEIIAQQTYTKAPVRYTEATLVKQMETLEIGRPSTYATIIDTIQTRQYVKRGSVEGQKRDINVISLKGTKINAKVKTETFGADSGKLLPTDLGRATNDFLVKNFPTILSYDFTAQAEESFDEIARGEKGWIQTIDSFYHPFHEQIQKPQEALEWRILGNEPKSGKPIIAKIGRKGTCIQIGTAQDDEKPVFASLKPEQSIYTITYKEALDLFKTPFPYSLGDFENEEMTVGIGMYGPYIKHNNNYYSIPKTLNAEALSAEEAIGIIEQKRQAVLPIRDFGDIKILNGKWGAYIKFGEKNYKLDKTINLDTISEKECKQIIAEQDAAPVKPKKVYHKKAK